MLRLTQRHYKQDAIYTMIINELVTHSGSFHADELLSSVVLTRLHPKARVIRSRDPKWITPETGRIIFDVGGAYDPDALIFDHHQRPGPLRPNGQPYSSFGLIWAHFGRAFLRACAMPEDQIASVHQAIDARLVLPIDLVDNGALDPSNAGPLSRVILPVMLENLHPPFDHRTAAAEDAAFDQALGIARVLLDGLVTQLSAQYRAQTIVNAAITAAGNSPILELPQAMPYRAAIEQAGADHLLFVIHPRDQDWAINGIKLTDDGFEQRADLPLAWAGLSDTALEHASGVNGAKFCHSARFIAVAKTREAALTMAHIAVEQAQQTAQ